MADIGRELLAAIEAILITETASGESLEAIKSFFVLYSSSESPPEYATVPPVLKVDMLPIIGKTITCIPHMIEKEYPIRFSFWNENQGETRDQTAAIILDAVEDIFINNRMGVSQTVDAPQKDYSIPSSPPFEAPVNGGWTMTITHRDVDVRAK